MNKKYDLKSMLWAAMALMMVWCLIIGIMLGDPVVICWALFAFSVDGYNAWSYFKLWRKTRKGW